MIKNEDPVLDWDITRLSAAYNNKEISPVEVTKKVIARINSINGLSNAYITVDEEQALLAAHEAERVIIEGSQKSKLHGVPIGLKDLINTSSMKTTMGSQLYKDYVPANDATVVAKLKQAGAIMIGKLNTHEFAYGTTGDISYFGPVKNPYDETKVSGGSSSGSAVAVATRTCYGALGTDTGGSIRIPGSFCGIVGMKPTFGRVSKYGVYPLAPTLDHVGPMTKTVTDNAILLNTLISYDAKDMYSVKRQQEDFTADFHKGLKGIVIGVPSTFFFDHVDEEITSKIEEVLTTYKKLGAIIRTIEIDNLTEISRAHGVILKAEAFTTHRNHLAENNKGWKGEVRDRLITGKAIKAYEYLEAMEVKRRGIKAFNKVFSEVDVILSPVTSIMPTDLYERDILYAGRETHVFSVLNKLTGISNVTGLPSITVPCGLASTGLPVGFELTGKAYAESMLYRIAYAYEQEMLTT